MVRAVVLLLVGVMMALGASEIERIELRMSDDPRPVHVERLGINLNYLVDAELRAPDDGIPLVAGLRELGVRSLRYPGGDKSDSHLWSVPPFERPAPRLAVTGEWDWPAMEPRIWDRAAERFALEVLDTDDALRIADELDAELVMVVPYDELVPGPEEEPGRYANDLTLDQLIETAVGWARYCRDQGHPVRYWEIGNETYFHAGVTAERYAADLVRFAEALRAVDPAIRIGANGPEDVESVAAGDQHAGTGTKWWPAVLAAASAQIDYVSIHRYPCWQWESFATYTERRPEVLGQLRRMRGLIDEHAASADRERIELLVTETNSADWKKPDGWPHEASIGHALVLFDMLAQYLGHDDLVTVQVWNTRWVPWEGEHQLWNALDEGNHPTAIGQAMALWASAGSHWLDAEHGAHVLCFATHDPVTGAATMFLVNRTTEAQVVALSGELVAAAGTRTAQPWSGAGPDDLAPVFGAAVAADPARLTVPAAGMLIVTFAPER